MGGGQLMNGPNLAPTGYMSSQSRPMLQVYTVPAQMYKILDKTVQSVWQSVHTGLHNCSAVELHSNVTL